VLKLPGLLPSSATLYISDSDNDYVPIKTVKIDNSGTFRFFDCPFPISCFPFENFSLGVEYEPTLNIYLLYFFNRNTRNLIKILNLNVSFFVFLGISPKKRQTVKVIT